MTDVFTKLCSEAAAERDWRKQDPLENEAKGATLLEAADKQRD
jgi:hypothetical protein